MRNPRYRSFLSQGLLKNWWATEVTRAIASTLGPGAVEEFRQIGQHLDEIAKRAPTMPDGVYDAAETRVATRPILSVMQVGSRDDAAKSVDRPLP